ncbi:MAG: DUF4390 domain-containing protein [Candidatus Rokuibacteriota bacterium]
MRVTTLVLLLLAGTLTLASGLPVQAELRVSELAVFLNNHEVTVHAVLLGALPPEFLEGLHSGLPTHVRIVIELFRYNRFRPDSRVNRAILERTLTYNVVTKEYKVSLGPSDARSPVTTRELRDAERMLSDVQGVKLTPATRLDLAETYYVRVDAETTLNGDGSWMARMSGMAARASRQSDYRTPAPIR